MNLHLAPYTEFSSIASIRWLHGHRRGLVALLYAWFVVYSTLLPFDFHWTIGQRNLASLGETLQAHRADDNRTDLVLNILLYIPLGASICLAIRHRVGWWWVGMIASGLVGALLSATIEFLQLFSSSRVGSTTDVLTNTAGTVIGCAAAPVIAWIMQPMRRRRRELMAAQPVWHLATWAAIALIVCGFVPFDVREDLGQLREGLQSAHLRPFWQLAHPAGTPASFGPEPATFWVNFAGDVGAFLLFSVIMAMAATAGAQLGAVPSIFMTLWSGIGLAVLIEVGQIMIASRGFDTTDVIAAAAGVAVGALFGTVAGRLAARRRWRWGDSQPLLGTPLLVLTLLGQAGYVIAQGLEPFRFARLPGGEALWAAIGPVPFRGYTDHLTPALVAEFVLKLVRYGLLGVFLMMLLRQAAFARSWSFARCVAAAVAAAMFLSAAIETTQLAIPGRYCDVTDVVIAAMGALAGAVGTQWYIEAVRYARLRVRHAAGAALEPAGVGNARSA